jgi:TPR repeat protein
LVNLRFKAEKGDAKSQLEYGKAIKVESKAEAFKWIKKAAVQKLGEAWYWLGYAGIGKK